MILLAGFIGGLVVAWLLGADLRRMDRLELRGGAFIFAALALELGLFIPHIDVVPAARVGWLNAGSYCLVCCFMVRNLRRPGFALAALGAASNSLVILANRGFMPVPPSAWVDSGRSLRLFSHAGTFANNVLRDGTHLGFLGDVFAVPRGIPLATPISIGDLLIVAGAVVFIYRACTPPLEHPGSRLLAPLQVAAYRHLILARVASSAGDWISLTAVVTWLFAEYRSTSAVAAFMVVRILAASLGGVIAARGFVWMGRYRILTAVEAARGVLTGLMIPCAVFHEPVLVVLLASVSAMIGAATRAGTTSLIASILPVEALQAGNAIHGVARNTVMVVATFGSALAFIHFGIATALELDLATFVFAALAYQTYARRETHLQIPEGTGIRTVGEQLGWIFRNRVCSTLILSFSVATGAIGLFNAALPDFMAHHVGESNGYGFALAFIGLGFALGEGATAFIHRESVARRSVGLAFFGNAALLWVLGHSAALPTEFLALALLGVSDGTTEVVFDTLVQRSTPPALQASVFALAGVLQNVGMVAGLVLAPVAVAATGATTPVTLAAGGCTAAALLAAAGLHSGRARISAADSLHDELAGQQEAT
jgi:uncharacterized protein DUF5317/MFS transporter